MYRAMAILSVVAGLGILSWAAPAPKQPPSMADKVNQRINFPGIDDPKITLQEALDQLSKKYDVSFDINEQAFKMDGLMEVSKTPIADSFPLPAMKNVRLGRVLTKILSRIPATSGSAYYVRGDYILITTGLFHATAIWSGYTGPYLPLVNLALDKCPLEDAVREMAELTDFNVVMDNRVGDKAKTLVSARLLNTPLDTALRLLTDMADLRFVHIDNVLYVTTKENAAAWEASLEKETAPTNPLKGAGPATKGSGELRRRRSGGPDYIIIRQPEGP